jgi:hypothetical protein
MSFDPCNCSLKIRKSIGTPIPKVGVHLGVWGVHSLTLSYIPESMKCESWASFLVYTLSSPCFGREPKMKVVTTFKCVHTKNAFRSMSF